MIKVIHIITELSSGGAQALLVNLLADPAYRAQIEPLVTSLFNADGSMAHKLRDLDVPVIALGLANWRQPGALLRLHQLLRAEKPQVIHGWLFHANLLARLAGRLAGVPVVITSRHSVSIGGPLREGIQRLTNWMDDAVVAVGDAVCQAEIAQSHTAATKVTIVRNNVRVEAFADQYGNRRRRARAALIGEEATFLVGSVGRFAPVKGFDLLVQAFAHFHARIPDSRLVLVGEGAIRSEIEALVSRSGLQGHVLLLGERNDVADLLTAFDLFVLASRWEGIPVVVLEAMAARLPVVATAVGGTPEVVEQEVTGLLVPPEDVAALAAAMLRLANDEALRTRLVQAARERVETDFSTAHATQMYLALYRRLLLSKGFVPK